MTYLLLIALLLACSWLAWRLKRVSSDKAEVGRKLCSAEIKVARLEYELQQAKAERPEEEWKEWLEEV